MGPSPGVTVYIDYLHGMPSSAPSPGRRRFIIIIPQLP